MIERRGAISRRAMFCIEEKFRSGGLRVSMPDLLSEALFAVSLSYPTEVTRLAVPRLDDNRGYCRTCWSSWMTQPV
eukprot:771169-Pyramimonas_sp.AAC.1